MPIFIGQNTLLLFLLLNLILLMRVFKLWTASKTSTGTSLIVGEHGGLGVGLLNGTHRYELSIADTYLSTGWTSSTQPKIVPVGHFRQKVFQIIHASLF